MPDQKKLQLQKERMESSCVCGTESISVWMGTRAEGKAGHRGCKTRLGKHQGWAGKPL